MIDNLDGRLICFLFAIFLYFKMYSLQNIVFNESKTILPRKKALLRKMPTEEPGSDQKLTTPNMFLTLKCWPAYQAFQNHLLDR